ncbi:MAG: hypothetical protein ACFE7E_05990 [Candidatus Hodarchaeota archaeon]
MDNEQMIRAELTKWDEKHYKMACPICARKIPFKLNWNQHMKNVREADGNPYGISIIHGEGSKVHALTVFVDREGIPRRGNVSDRVLMVTRKRFPKEEEESTSPESDSGIITPPALSKTWLQVFQEEPEADLELIVFNRDMRSYGGFYRELRPSKFFDLVDSSIGGPIQLINEGIVQMIPAKKHTFVFRDGKNIERIEPLVHFFNEIDNELSIERLHRMLLRILVQYASFPSETFLDDASIMVKDLNKLVRIDFNDIPESAWDTVLGAIGKVLAPERLKEKVWNMELHRLLEMLPLDDSNFFGDVVKNYPNLKNLGIICEW